MCEHIIAHNLHDEKKLDAQSWTDARTTIQAYPTTGSWAFSLKDKQRKGGRHAYRRTKGAEAWGGKGGDNKHTEP